MPPGRRTSPPMDYDRTGFFTAGLKSRPAVEGHRGAGYAAPPNSMESILVASQLGLDSVEFDVWMLKCGSLIVAHGPEYLDANDIGLRKYTVEELKHDLEEFSMFSEVVQFCLKKNMKMNIDVKGDNPDAIDEILKQLNCLDATHLASISSFDSNLLKRALEIDPSTSIGVLHDPYLVYSDNPTFIPSIKQPLREDFATYLARPGDSVNLGAEVITPDIVEKAHKHGLKVMAWFACVPQVPEANETLMAYERLIRAGVDTICCNHPQRLIDYLDARFLRSDTTNLKELKSDELLNMVVQNDKIKQRMSMGSHKSNHSSGGSTGSTRDEVTPAGSEKSWMAL